ncbi:hypothetical protein [Paludisphaera sp.]|uniref:hypothetical protein n=1 Tax=Paludisphaera sp. TaxID=2017432 RepID=UPI00301D1B02
MKDERRAELPCPACGGRSYSRGEIRAQGLRFIPNGLPFWKRFFWKGMKLPARRCDDCGHLQVFSRPHWDRVSGRGRDHRRDADFE